MITLISTTKDMSLSLNTIRNIKEHDLLDCKQPGLSSLDQLINEIYSSLGSYVLIENIIYFIGIYFS